MKQIELYDVGGEELEVAPEHVEQFKQSMAEEGRAPVRLERYEAGGEQFSVAENNRDEFLKAKPDAERVRRIEAGGETLEIADRHRTAFMKEFRTNEKYAAERDEIAQGVKERLAGVVDESAGHWWDGLGKDILRSEANLARQGYAAAPLTLAEKGLDAMAFVNRGLETVFGDMSGDSAGARLKRQGLFVATGGMMPGLLIDRKKLKGAKEAVEGFREKYLFELGDEGDWGVRTVGQVMNSINESLLTGGVSKAAGIAQGAKNLSMQTMIYALSQGEQTADKAELKGLSREAQMGLGMAAGAVEGTLEYLSQFIGLQKGAREAVAGGIAKRVMERVAGALGEGVTESGQSFGTAFIEKMAGLDERTWGEIMKQVALEGAMGLMAGGMMEAAEAKAIGLFDGGKENSNADMDRKETQSQNTAEQTAGAGGEETQGVEVDPETGRGDDDAGVYENTLTEADVIEAADIEDVEPDDSGALTVRRKAAEGDREAMALQVAGVGFKRLESGEKVRVARVVDEQGKEQFVYDRGLVDLADYYMRFGMPESRETVPENGSTDLTSRKIAKKEFFADFGKSVGFPVKAGKRIFVMLGRSSKPYKATIVDAVDGEHVRIHVDKTQRSQKNRQSGYQIIDGKNMKEFTAARRRREFNEQMKEVPKEKRREVMAQAKEFRDLIMSEHELVDQKLLNVMSAPGSDFSSKREGVIADEVNKAYQMLADMWGEKDLDLSNPVRRAENIEKLKELLQGYEEERSIVESSPPDEVPEMVELRSFRNSLYNELNRKLSQPIDEDYSNSDAMAVYRAYVAELEQQIGELNAVIDGSTGEQRTAATTAAMTDIQQQWEDVQRVNAEFEEELGDEGIMFTSDRKKSSRAAPARTRAETQQELEKRYGMRLADVNLWRQDSGGGGTSGENTESGRFRAAELGSFGMDLRDAVKFFMDIYKGRRAKVKNSGMRGHPGYMTYAGSDVDIFLATRIFGLVSVQDAQDIRREIENMGYAFDEKMVDKMVRKRLMDLIEKRKKEPIKAPVKVLLHEISHVVDYLPDFNFPGGNVFGHIMNLNKQLKHAVPGWPGGPEPMTQSEKSKLRRSVEKEVTKLFAEMNTKNEAGITAEDIQNLVREEAGKATPELYEWFARQDSQTKREVLQAALKGVVSDQLQDLKEKYDTSPEAYKQAVKKRYAELWRAEVERRFNLEIKFFKQEAYDVIKWWNGSELAIEYFMNDPAEMYAQLFSVFLGDPAGLEQRAPMVWRAFNGYMDARPEIRDVYNKYQVQRHSGMSRQREHVARLVESFAIKHNEDQYAKLIKEMNTPGSEENLMQARFLFDRTTGPLYMMVKKANQLAGDTERSRAQRDQIFGRVKDVLHSINTVRLMLIDIHDQVSTKLKEAGLNWWNLAEYAFHGRVVNELDGRAASYGWEPKTSAERLREMQENEFHADQWNTLQQSWQNFREIYEQFALNGTGVREMLGDDIHDLLMKNVHYVTFKHVPTPAEVGKTMEERRKIAEEHGKDAVTAYDIVNVEMARKYGDQSAHIYELKGSFDPLADPLTASIQKAAKLMEAGLINDLKLQVVSFLRESGFQGMRPAKRGSGGKLESVNDSRRKTVYFMQNGKMQGVVMSKWLAESLDFGRGIDRVAMLQPFMKVNQTMAALYTRLRYGFWEPAYEKDKQSAVANIKGLKRSPLASLPWVWGAHPGALFTRYMPDSVIDFISGNKLTSWMLNDSHFEFYESQARRVGILVENGGFEAKIYEAQRLEQQGNIKQAARIREDVAIARRVLKSNILMVMQDVTMPGQGLSEYDRECAKYGLKLDQEQAGNAWEYIKNHVDTAWQGYTRLGEIRENTTKIASMLYLERKSELNPAQIKTTVSELGGSPDFSERGLAAGYAEFIIKPFLNARKEGMARSIKAAKDHPGDYAMSKMAYTVAPTTLRWMLASGALVALIKQAVDDDDLLENSWAFQSLKWLSNKYSYVSDYLSKNYITAVLPYDMGDDCALVMTIPMDETEQAFSGLVWAGLDSIADGIFKMDVKKTDKNMLESAVYPLLTDYLPGAGGGPLISGIWPWINTYFRSAHTMDTFRGHNVLSDDELKRKYSKPDAAKKLAGHTWNAFGGGTIWNWKPPEQRLNMTKAEEILNAPGIQPFLGRYIRIVRNGRAQNLSVIEGDAENARADTRLTARNLFIKGLQNDKFYTEEVVKHIQSDGYFSDYYTDLVRKYYDQSTPKKKEFDALKKASKRDPEQLRRIMKKIESWD